MVCQGHTCCTCRGTPGGGANGFEPIDVRCDICYPQYASFVSFCFSPFFTLVGSGYAGEGGQTVSGRATDHNTLINVKLFKAVCCN